MPKNEISGMIKRAKDAGIGALINSCADPDDPAKAIKLCEQYENMFCTIGIHPEYAGKAIPNYNHLLSHPKTVGVGEIGLDFHYGSENCVMQIELFRAQLEIASTAGLPVAVHSRNARQETIEILCAPEFAKLGGDGVPGVMHFHCMPWEFTKILLDRGFYFSAAGLISFKNADKECEVFRMLPLDRIVIETDAPWCAPVPYRGKTCEPAMIIETARILANLHDVPIVELEHALFENTKRLYPKMNPFLI
ncbi:MAG: TatD family hydrolase [Alphaproteobacteria bacterium]|nr:TatD family hydrolase [Alphaproteobacteria bacterium]